MARDTLTVAVAQMNSVLAAIDANARNHESMIADSRDRGVDVLVFPELSLTGYALGRRTLETAMPASAPPLVRLAAASGDMTTVVGFVENAGPGACYNAAAILRHGRVVAVHRKINLPTYGGLEEGKWFHKGTQPMVFDVDQQWSAAALVCADLWNPALVHQTMAQRPDLVLAPANSATAIVSSAFSNERNWGVALGFYAMMYSTPIAFANRYGPEGDVHFWGGSAVYGPRGDILASAGDREEVVAATIERDTIAQARFDLPTHRDSAGF